ncbi:MAG: hypothetical protein K8I02_04790, partial [Candidatus Methylomirabilis sp.]|nr:hypothetical protein [Deltaproteobacteria bacterium]
DQPPPGAPAEYLILKPRVQEDPTRPPLFPQLDRNLDFSIRSEAYAGDPGRLLALRLVYASRFKGPFYQGVPRARLYLKNFARGGAWEEVVSFEEPTAFQKSVRIVRRANPLDYLSPEGHAELRVTTLDGGLYNEFFLEHVRFELEAL